MSDRGTAIHESGHAVAAFWLGRSIRRISIVAEHDSLGHVLHFTPRKDWMGALEEADYDGSHGRFINGQTRRWVEIEVMISLAGGLSEMRATGLDDDQVGMGLVRLSAQEAAELLSDFGDAAADVRKLIVAGDYRWAFDLTAKVSGSDDEGAAYLAWLEQRTLSMMAAPGFWGTVEIVADLVLAKKTVSGRALRQYIDSAASHARDAEVADFLRQHAGS